MRRALIVALAAVMLALPARAHAAGGLPQNVQNGFFFMTGCAKYMSSTSPPPNGAVCFDTTTGGTYMWNGSAFVPSGSQILLANGGSGQTTATTGYFAVVGYMVQNAYESNIIPLLLPVQASIRNLSCTTYPAPGPGASDTFTLRSSSALGATMANTKLTCTISDTATTCTDNKDKDAANLPAGSTIDYGDTTTGTPVPRVIACSLQMDHL